jgi:hypothetical protein
MDASRSELLGALASDAALERSDFLVSATDQLKRFSMPTPPGSRPSAG